MTSTVPPEVPERHLRRSRATRRAGLAALAVVVLLGATGQLGTRTASARATAGPYQVTVLHPAVSRSGHAVRLEFVVRRIGGFPPDEPVRLRFLADYFDLFDENAFTPQPDAELSDGRYVIDEFLPPEGEVLVVEVDTRVEPARNVGERGEVAVLDADSRPLVAVAFRTRLLP